MFKRLLIAAAAVFAFSGLARADDGHNNKPSFQIPVDCGKLSDITEFLASLGEVQEGPDNAISPVMRILLFANKEQPSTWTLVMANDAGLACIVTAGAGWYKGKGV